MESYLPAGATEALLWYDTTIGRAGRRIALTGSPAVRASVVITPSQEGLTLTEKLATPALDYWWAVRGADGTLLRKFGSAPLAPQIVDLARTEPITAPPTIAWVQRNTPHFRLYAAPGTAAERDLERLSDVAEASYTQAATLLPPTQPISVSVYLVPRVFWQGGVAYGDGPLVISYLDRNYVGVEPWSYFVHEVAHALGGGLVPDGNEVGGLLGEGAAVYATGGHYSIEPVEAWAAVIAASDQYIPLCTLRNDFYAAQHEIAYIEGASFSAYLIRTYGLPAYKQIYAAQQPQRGGREESAEQFCEADNRRIVEPTGKTAGQLEQDWLAALRTLRPTDQQRRQWELTVRFFETMRRYEEQLDQPARDLPGPPDKWGQATAAAFLNPAMGRRAEVLETMLIAANHANHAGEVEQADALLDAIDQSIAANGSLTGTLTREYNAVAEALDTNERALRLGDALTLGRMLGAPELAARLPFTTRDLLFDLRYTLSSLELQGDTARAIVEANAASMDGRKLHRVLYRARFERTGGMWRLTEWDAYQPEIAMPPGPSGVGFGR